MERPGGSGGGSGGGNEVLQTCHDDSLCEATHSTDDPKATSTILSCIVQVIDEEPLIYYIYTWGRYY